jgi:crotonobetainyl-CoA:carnitine CoA-transferase CaiB-like acyl-CoA transferase
MGKQTVNQKILEPFRVLDLTDEKGFLCGKILADMGADVIKLEKPGGDVSRHIGPFYNRTPDTQKSLFWFAYNLNKRGITLNIENTGGKDIFKKLVKDADFVIESFPTGYMEKLGLGYSELSDINPRIIMTSITPFGQTGPYKHYKGSDITVMAMGGLMYITGNPDQIPLRISFPQSFLITSAHAAAATMIAHYHRQTTGEGQHVDSSAQQCVLWEIANAIPLWELNRIILKRVGSYQSGRLTETKQRLLWKCRDGYIIFVVIGGAFGVKANKRLFGWMEEEGMSLGQLKDFDWDSFDMAQQTPEMQDMIESPIAEFFTKFTKAELYEGALKRGIMLCPVSTAGDIVKNKQLSAREFWVDIDHPELSTSIPYPGAFIKMSETPCELKHRAPLIGEHNQEIYEKELGISGAELASLRQNGSI